MDNWIVFLLVNVVLVIVLGILTNLATPWVKSAYERSIFSSRKKRIESIIKEFNTRKELKKDGLRLINAYLIRIAYMVFVVLTMVIVLGMLLVSEFYPVPFFNRLDPATANIVMWFFSLFVYILVYRVMRSIRDVNSSIREFDKYREKVIKNLVKLGGNPEELDKEETT
jgi:hypothetical protein